MPELPEVETTRLGLTPYVVGKRVKKVVVRQKMLRWPVSRGVIATLPGQKITALRRRGKYLCFDTAAGSLIVHLGMSGSMHIVRSRDTAGQHDHVDIGLSAGRTLRFRDPRRFGTVIWTRGDPLQHKLLRSLGPEPLGPDFHARYLFDQAHGRRVAIKNFIMNGHVVVGVGNIYASEALFRAGIHPKRAAGRVALARMAQLVDAIREVLDEAIAQGGTSLRDFTGHDGQPGYFQQRLDVYGRAGEACVRCARPVHQATIGQRSSYYCLGCQT